MIDKYAMTPQSRTIHLMESEQQKLVQNPALFIFESLSPISSGVQCSLAPRSHQKVPASDARLQ